MNVSSQIRVSISLLSLTLNTFLDIALRLDSKFATTNICCTSNAYRVFHSLFAANLGLRFWSFLSSVRQF
jgi:hypothetical protein